MREDRNIEFKSSFNDAVIETLVAFANTQGGEIYLGVNDLGQPLKRFKIGKESVQKWLNEIKLKTHPVVIPDATEIIYKGQTVLKLSIPEFPIKPVSFRGRFYKRVINSNHLLSLDEIVNLHTQSIKSSFDSVPTDLKTEDLRPELIDRFFVNIKNTGRFKLAGEKIFQLKKLGLISENKLTLAAALLFADHNTAIHIGRFKTRDHILDDVLIKSPLLEAVDEAILFIKKHIKLEYRFTDQLKRDEPSHDKNFVTYIG